ncbi:MAG: TetR/AcrR family transcriptional regulator [Oscillospiraceae bacterium]|nr:TetR/AcrR family transcriptional regulator [Oscillospiraceae bacterium]
MANLMKNEIKATFLRLLEERPYSQITVKEIVKECGVNRNTFYYHYADLPALVAEVIDEEIGRFVREQNSFSSLEESMTEALSFFREHRRAAYHVYNSVNRDIFDRYLMKNCESVGAGYVNSLLTDVPLSDEDRQAIIHFNAYVCFGAVTRWLESDMTYDIHEDFRRIFQLMIEPAMKQQGLEPLK